MQNPKPENKTRSRAVRVVCGALVGMGMAGCSASSFLPEAKADPTRFFVLSSPQVDAGAAPVDAAARKPVVRLRGIELASYLKTRPMIVRRGANEVEFREFARWGEPLEQGIGRVLREALLERGVGEVRLPGSRTTASDTEIELSVRILACEGTADGGVNFRAVWELQRAGHDAGNAETRRAGFRADGVNWDGRNEASLAAALSEAIVGLATEIAAALKP